MKSNLTYSIISILIIIIIFILINNTNNSDGKDGSDTAGKKIYYADNISFAQNKIIEMFNKAYEGRIQVVPINLPFSKFTTNERKEILARSLRSKSQRIDIFAVDIIWGPRFSKWSYPLDEHFDNSFLQRYLDHVIPSVKYNNHLIALPLYTDIGVLYYREDLLRKAGLSDDQLDHIKYSASWSEIIEIGRKSDPASPFLIFPGESFEGMICSFHEALGEDNINRIFLNTPVNLNTSAAKRSLQLLVDFIYKYKYTPPDITEFDENKSYAYAIEHDAVFFRGWPGFDKFAIENNLPQEKVKYIKMAAIPRLKGNKKNGVYGGWNLMISKFSNNIPESIEFLKFTSRIESQKILYEQSGYFPSIKEVYLDEAFIKQNPQLEFSRELLATGKHRPYLVDYTKISDIMSYYFQDALKKNITVEEALKNASEKINSRQVFIK